MYICTYVGILAAREGWFLGCTILPSHPTLSSLVALLDTADVDYRRGQSFAMSSMTFLMDSANKQQQFQTKVFWRWVPLCKMLWKCANHSYFFTSSSKAHKSFASNSFWSLYKRCGKLNVGNVTLTKYATNHGASTLKGYHSTLPPLMPWLPKVHGLGRKGERNFTGWNWRSSTFGNFSLQWSIFKLHVKFRQSTRVLRCLASANWACLAGHLVNGRRVQESTDALVGHLFTTNLRGWYPSNLTSILVQLGQQAFLEICFLLMKVQLSVWMLGELSDLVPGSPGELTCMVRRGHGRWISYKSVPLLCTEKNCLLDGTQEFNATDMRVLEDWRDDPHPPDCYRFWQATKSERSPFPVLWCFLIEGTLHHLR